jgi:hypothetical protein
LAQVMQRLISPPEDGETLEMHLSTRYLINHIRKLTGHDDLKQFERKWMHLS